MKNTLKVNVGGIPKPEGWDERLAKAFDGIGMNDPERDAPTPEEIEVALRAEFAAEVGQGLTVEVVKVEGAEAEALLARATGEEQAERKLKVLARAPFTDEELADLQEAEQDNLANLTTLFSMTPANVEKMSPTVRVAFAYYVAGYHAWTDAIHHLVKDAKREGETAAEIRGTMLRVSQTLGTFLTLPDPLLPAFGMQGGVNPFISDEHADRYARAVVKAMTLAMTDELALVSRINAIHGLIYPEQVRPSLAIPNLQTVVDLLSKIMDETPHEIVCPCEP